MLEKILIEVVDKLLELVIGLCCLVDVRGW